MEPLKFEPVLKAKLWGGDGIARLKGLGMPGATIGESWEISAVRGSESVVASGEFKGMTLEDVISLKRHELVGRGNYQRYGNEFPILVKFIDARDDLSVQVHPGDRVAERHGHPHGKAEMWYVMDAEPGARLLCGFSEEMTPERFCHAAEGGAIPGVLREYRAREGDCFFIPPGCVHGIGRGVLLAEIQQTLDVTYRIHDYGRRDLDGNFRELHVRQAAESIDFSSTEGGRVDYVPVRNEGVSLVRCPHFNVVVYDVDIPMAFDYSALDGFVAIVAVSGEGTFVDDGGNVATLRGGETMLVPATCKWLRVSGKIKFLEACASTG